MEKPNGCTETLLELVNVFSKVAEHEVNTHTLVVFLYTSNERSEKEITEQSRLHSIKRIK